MSRSRYIALAVSEKIKEEKKQFITEFYNNVFSNEKIQKEQLETARYFEGTESGQEW